MQTAFVARLTLVALCASPVLAPQLSAQDAPHPIEDVRVFNTAPRPREAAPDKPMLGVMVSNTDDGVLISEVMEGSLAEQAGLQPGDLLLSLGGERLDDYTGIGEALSGLEPGETLGMTVVRDGSGLVKLEAQLPMPKLPEAHAAPGTPLPMADGHRGGFLGVELGEGSEQGVLVAGVIDNTAAWFAGLEAGDVLTHLDETALHNNEDLVGAVASKAAGSLVAIAYLREGVSSESHVRLGHRMPMALPGMPGSGQFFPDTMGEGNVWFGQLPEGHDQFFLPGQQLPSGVAVPHFQGEGNNFEMHGLEDLHEHLKELELHLDEMGVHDLDLDGLHELKIKIEDGKMTIEKDGEIETIEVDEHAGAHGLRLRNSSGAADASIGLFGADGALQLFAAPGSAMAPECTAIAVECDAAATAECAEAAAECAEIAIECAEAAAECCEASEADCKVECEVEVIEEVADDDIL